MYQGPKWIKGWPDVENNWSPCLQTLEGHTNPVLSVVFSYDEQLLASGSHDNTIRIRDTKTGALLQTLQGHTDSVHFSSLLPGCTVSGVWFK